MSAPNSNTGNSDSNISPGDLRQILSISTSLTDDNRPNQVAPVDQEVMIQFLPNLGKYFTNTVTY